MAKSYLGKISALVTANTSDFNRKLDESAQRTRSFAASVKSQINAAERAASKSLDGIYTSLQKVERALSAAGGRRLSLIDEREANKIRQLVSAAEEVYRPLERAAKASEKLGADVRANFQPALIAAQKSAEALNRAIESGGTVGAASYARVRRQVELTAEAIDRLSEAQASLGGLATGRELRFQSPGLVAALDDARREQERAARIDPRRAQQLGLGAIQGRQFIAAQRAAEANALVEDARLNVARRPDSVRFQQDLQAAVQLAREADTALETVTAELRAQLDVLDAQVSREQQLVDLARSRAQAASRFLNVDQRESDLVSNAGLVTNLDPSGRTIQQRVRDIDQLRTAEGSLRAEQEARLAVANSLLNVDQRESDLLSLSGSATGGGRVDLQQAFRDNLEREARARMGGDIPGGPGPGGADRETGRQVDNVIDRVGRLRQQIDSLPDGIRSAFIPALQQATDQAATLARAGFGATADQIRRATTEAERLEQNVRGASAALNFEEQFGGAGLEFGLQEISLRSYTAQLQVLQQALSGAASEARGPALNAFNQLRGAISQAAARGTLDTRQTRAEIRRLTEEATRAAAAAAGVSPGRLGRSVQRAGDVGRNAFANIGLGVQQAVFAIEDFFSVTGGLDQRIRAAGNNISQLGFVLGGTTGLITGVSVAITGQLIAALIRWSNAGVGTEDTVKSLNDSLSRQKSLVESLADAFSSLATEIGRIGLSKQGAEAAQFSRQLDDIRKKQGEFNTEQVAVLDPEVQRQRGIVAARERELSTAVDPGERIRLTQEIRDARQRQRERIAELQAAPAITPQEAIRRAAEAQFAVDVAAGRDEEAARLRRDAAIDEGNQRLQGRDQSFQVLIARSRIRAEQDRLRDEINQNTTFFGESDANIERRRRLADLEQAAISLESGATKAANSLEIEVVKASQSAARSIGVAQDKVAKAIESGVQGATGLQVELDVLTESLQKAQDDLADAQKAARESGRGGDLGAAESAREEVQRIQETINIRQEEVAAIDAARRSFEAFSGIIDRIVRAADQTVNAAESELQRAEREQAVRPSPATDRELAQAQRDAEAAQEQRARVEAEAAQAAERQRNDPQSQQRQRRIAEIDSQLATTGVLAPGQRESMIAERERLRDEERRRIDPILEQARRDEQEFSARQESARRGREIGQTPAERAGQDLARNLVDLQNAFDTTVGPQVPGDLAADQQRVINEALRSVAPAIFGLADQVQNAVLQGPSRAALQASDVTTAQGAAELNRLLRGDDSARNQDLVELQKQSNSLEELVRIARESGAPPGVLDL